MADELLSRLQSFAFDAPGAALSFAQRLAHENGWTAPFAARVLDEYRRFLWLAMRAGHPVTPSPAVDAAWHLHLAYTRSYWDELCGRVLQRALHHDPTRGGSRESAKYHDWYARTLASYRAWFGEPPADVWPDVAERFRGGLPRIVDRRTHWIVDKRWVRRAAAVAAGALAVSVLAGCAGGVSDQQLVTLGVVAFVGLGAFAAIAVARSMKSTKDQSRDGGGGSCGGGAGCGGSGRHHGDGDGSGCGADGGGGCGGGGGD